MTNIAVIGAGASGLFLTKLLSESTNANIFVFEKTSKPGYKIKASGGGKANILNTQISGECYNNQAFIANLLSRVNYETIYKKFEQMGLKMTVDEENRVYPSTFFSQTVLDVLLYQLSEKVHFIYDYEVQHIHREKQQYQINDYPTRFDKVVIASGSPAGMIGKNRKNFNLYLNDLNIIKEDFLASLVGFKIKNYPAQLSGCRCKAVCSLYQGKTLIHQEKGEVTFKDDGISGIVILNLSAYYNRLKDKNHCSIHLNLMYDDPSYDVAKHWQRFHSFCGLIHPKLNKLYEQKAFDLRHFALEISEPYELEFAQVCHGGIVLDEVNEDFELKKHPNIFAIGEALNIDGICGGYNLFFAWASAWVVAQKMRNCFYAAQGK